jgi:hypothetical protein
MLNSAFDKHLRWICERGNKSGIYSRDVKLLCDASIIVDDIVAQNSFLARIVAVSSVRVTNNPIAAALKLEHARPVITPQAHSSLRMVVRTSSLLVSANQNLNNMTLIGVPGVVRHK